MDPATETNQMRETLLAHNVPESEIESTISQVADMIVERVLHEYITKSTDQELKKMYGTTMPEEIFSYIEKNASSLPPISAEQFKKTAEEVWADYFSYLDNI